MRSVLQQALHQHDIAGIEKFDFGAKASFPGTGFWAKTA